MDYLDLFIFIVFISYYRIAFYVIHIYVYTVK